MDSKESVNEVNCPEMLSSSPINSSFILPSADGSPPRVVTLEEVKNVFKNLKNMSLAHEIALNPEFKLQPFEPSPDSLEYRVKQMVHKAFWDVLRTELNQDPPCYNQAINLLADIKECFSQILTVQNQRTLDYINEVLDATVIKQQAERGVLDFKSYANFVIQIMSKSCAPARDEAVKKLSQSDDVVETFRGILEVMTMMKLDMANYLLDLARNDILNNSVEYEKEKFREYLEYYKFDFPATEAWLKRNYKYVENFPIRNLLEESVYNAYMELIDWPADAKFPEVISMDKERIFKLSARAKRICLATSIMSIAVSVPIIGQIAENRKALAHQIQILLQDLTADEKGIMDTLENIYEQIRVFINEHLTKKQLPIIAGNVAVQLKNQVVQLENKASPVRQLMWKRLIIFTRFGLHKLVFDLPKELPGYNDYMEELTAFALSFKRVISYNHSVFGEYFMKIVEKQLNKNTSNAKSSKDNGASSSKGASSSSISGGSTSKIVKTEAPDAGIHSAEQDADN